MWQEWGHIVGSGGCGRVWGHVAGMLAGCGGMWQGWVCGRRSGL